jgi:hypothetical protein
LEARSAYVYYGAAVGLGAGERVAADASLLGGTFIAGVGDVDGDGYGDVAIGDTNRWEPRDSGLVRIHFGGADCLLRRVVTLEGTTRTTSRFGFSVNGGDFDGDGLGDLVMGAPADLYDCGTSSTSVGSGAFLFLGASLARSEDPLHLADHLVDRPDLRALFYLDANCAEALSMVESPPPRFRA